jgi:hypothetical protein
MITYQSKVTQKFVYLISVRGRGAVRMGYRQFQGFNKCSLGELHTFGERSMAWEKVCLACTPDNGL